jgi:hypothetical protein
MLSLVLKPFTLFKINLLMALDKINAVINPI